MGMIKPGIS